MKTFQKNYIGKGKRVADLNILKITIRVDALNAIGYEYEGIQYVTFEVAEMLHPDQFGRTHTVYHNALVEVIEPSIEFPVEQPKKRTARKPKVTEPLPF
jgi:hypothetical protein